MAVAISILAFVVAICAFVMSAAAARRARPRTGGASPDYLPRDTAGLRREVAALVEQQAQALRHLAVVRYDAFGDAGGNLSWTLALLDDAGDGVLVTSIHGRSETRTYAKSVRGGASEQSLTPEEEQALGEARRR